MSDSVKNKDFSRFAFEKCKLSFTAFLLENSNVIVFLLMDKMTVDGSTKRDRRSTVDTFEF